MRLIEMNVYAGVILAAILIFRKLGQKRMSALVRRAMWGLFLLRLVLPFTLQTDLSLLRLPGLPDTIPTGSVKTAGPEARAVLDEQPIQQQPTGTNTATTEVLTSGTIPAANTVQPDSGQPAFQLPELSTEQWLYIVWAAGVIISLGVYTYRAARFNSGLKKDAMPCTPGIQRVAEDCKNRLGIRRQLPVYLVGEAAAPAITASLRPRILLPVEALEMDESRLRFMLMHEMTHYRHRDHITCLITALLKAVHWFNPLVYYGISQMRLDMEVYCDSKVQAAIGPTQTSAYRLAIVDMFTSGDAQPALSMAHNSSRKMAEARIKGMFMHKSSSNAMRMVALALAVAMAGLGFTTACQPTPDKPVVVSKNDGKIDQKLAETAQPGEGIRQMVSKGETWNEQLNPKDDKTVINVNATIEVPDVDSLPVMTVRPYSFTTEDARRFAELLLQGKPVYEPKHQLTKAELQAEIDELLLALADPANSKSDGLRSGDPDTIAEVTKMFQERIVIMQQQQKTAPEKVERVASDFAFKPSKVYDHQVLVAENIKDYSDLTDDEQAQQILKEYDEAKQLIMDADLGSDLYGRIKIYNYSSDKYEEHMMSFAVNDAPFGDAWRGTDALRKGGYSQEGEVYELIEPCPYSLDQAETMATEMVAKLADGEWGMTWSSFSLAISDELEKELQDDTTGKVWEQAEEDVKQGKVKAANYTFTFQRVLSGVPIIQDELYFDYNEEYGSVYTYETIRITVNDLGVSEVIWESAYEFMETENENVKILPFEEIKDIIRQQAELQINQVKLTHYSEENPDYDEFMAQIERTELDITTVKLCMRRVPVQNEMLKYRLIPVWVVRGIENVVFKEGSPMSNGSRGETTQLVINAIDGSQV